MAKLKVALLQYFAPDLAAMIRGPVEAAGFDLAMVPDLSDASQAAALADCDFVIAQNAGLRGANLPPGNRIRVVQKWGAGYDSVDVEALKARGIPLLRTAGGNARYVAEMALFLMIGARRNLLFSGVGMAAGRWESGHWTENSSLFGKTVGIVGYGAIGQALAKLLAPFGCRILVTTRRKLEEPGIEQVPLGELLAQSDVVSLHAPLDAGTRGMIGEKELRSMKKSAVLVNTARGALIDETALLRALDERVIAAVGLDVFWQEPLPADHPLRGRKNAALMPHNGGKVIENFVGSVEHVVDNLSRLARGEKPPAADVVFWPQAD